MIKTREHFTYSPQYTFILTNNYTGAKTSTIYTGSGYYAGYSDYTDAPFDRTKFRPGVFKVTDITRRRYAVSYEPDPGSDQVITGYKWKYRIEGNYLPCALQMANLYPGAPLPVTTEDSKKHSICLLGAASKVSAPDLDGALFLAELGSTLRMLKKPFRLFTGKWNAFQRVPRALRNANPKRVVNYLSDKWLEYRYGIMPLINDIDTMFQLYHHRQLQYYSRIRYKSHRLPWQTPWQTKASSSVHPLSNLWIGYTMEEQESMNYVGRVYYKMVDGSYVHRSMAQLLGFDVLSLPSLMWELVPYSFCVDWVFSVGDWLKAHQPKPDIDQFCMTSSVKHRFERQFHKTWFTAVDPIARPEWISYGKILVQRSWMDSYRRFRVYQLPAYPQVRWDLYGLKQTIDSLSLLWQSNVKRR